MFLVEVRFIVHDHQPLTTPETIGLHGFQASFCVCGERVYRRIVRLAGHSYPITSWMGTQELLSYLGMCFS